MRQLFPQNKLIPPRWGSGLRLAVGDAPGETEAEQGEPFAGGNGSWLRGRLEGGRRHGGFYGAAHIADATLTFTNVIQCRPPNDAFPTDAKARGYIGAVEAQRAVEHCVKAHLEPVLRARKWERIDLFGDKALRAATGRRESITEIRGTPLAVPAIDAARPLAIPTLHPREVARDQSMIPVIVNDLLKDLRPMPEHFNLFPSLADVQAFTATTFAFDIENDPKTEAISMVGLSDKPYHAIVVPFSGEYRAELKRIFATAKVVTGHNSVSHDQRILANNGVVLSSECEHWDTMLMHGLLFPDFPHSLDFLVRQFTNGGVWKSDKSSFELYNARDTARQFLCYQQMLPALRREGLVDLYRLKSVPLQLICTRMQRVGMRCDPQRLEEVRERVLREMVELEAALPEPLRTHKRPVKRRQLAPPGTVSLKTGKPIKYVMVPDEEEVCPWRSSEEKKKYLYDVLKLPPQANPKDQTKITVDKGALDKLIRRFGAQYPWLAKLKQLNKLATLASGFLNVERGVAGRIHPRFNVVGTSEGRLCVAPDTAVECPRDLIKYPAGKPLRELKVGDWVYSLDWERRLCLRRVKWIGPTGVKPTLRIRVRDQWDVETEFRVTKEHLVRMFHGEWKAAGTLKIGNRLCGMVRRGITGGRPEQRYARFFPSSKRRQRGESGGFVKEHRWVWALLNGYSELPSKWDIHHLDGNSLNNDPANLVKVLHAEHYKMHRPARTEEEIRGYLAKPETWPHHPKTLQRYARRFGLATNHTIISIEECPSEEVWDIEVEETHSFIGGGVALHNSSASPNFQNQPPTARYMYVPDSDQQVLINVDYRGMEGRLTAWFSRDTARLERMADPNFNEYKWAINIVDGTPIDEIEKDNSVEAPYGLYKRIILGMGYGLGARKIANTYGLLEGTVKKIQYEIKARAFPEMTRWQERTAAQAKRDGFLCNPFGRKRWFWTDSSYGESLAFLPASTGADIIFNAMIGLMYEHIGWPAELAEKVSPILRPLPREVELLVQVHDALVFKCPRSMVDYVIPRIREVMEQPWKQLAGFFLPVEVEVGESWGELEVYQPVTLAA